MFAFTGNPAYALSATQHSTAAVIYGVIGGVAALAGRAVAGNSFKQESTGGFGSSGGSSGSGDQNGSRSFTGGAYDPYNGEVKEYSSAINAPVQYHRHDINFGGENFVFDVLENNVSKNGRMRDLFRKLAEEN